MTFVKTEDRLSYQLAQTEHVVRARIERELREEGLGLIAWAVLNWVCRTPGLSVSELSNRVFISQQAVSKIVDGLVRDDLVVRRPRAGKRRTRDIEATQKGRELEMVCDQRVIEVETQLRETLTATEIITFSDVMRHFRATVRRSANSHA